MSYKIELLPTRIGDTLIITSIRDGDPQDETNILIDRGLNNGNALEPLLYLAKRGRSLDLSVITHHDSDQILNGLSSFPKMDRQLAPRII